MTYAFSLEQRTEELAAVVRGRMRVHDVTEFIGGAFAEVLDALAAQHLQPTGEPFAQYQMNDDLIEVAAGFPSSGPVTPVGRVEPLLLPGGTVATTMHIGSYDDVSRAYEELFAWVEGESLVPSGPPWECYLDGPEVAEPRTLVRLPCLPSDRDGSTGDGDPLPPGAPSDE